MILFTRYSIFWKYRGITLWPFIIINKRFKNSEALLNHEKIHLKQQLELLIIPFYIWYGIEFIVRYCQYNSWDKAYRNISFEREAFNNENNFGYLKERKVWAFQKYLKRVT